MRKVGERLGQPSISCEVFNASTGADLVWSTHRQAHEKERSAHSAEKRYGLVAWQEGRSRIKRSSSTPVDREMVWTEDAESAGSTERTDQSRDWFLDPRRPERSRLRHVRTLILDQVASVGAYTVAGTRAGAALRRADDSGVCRLDKAGCVPRPCRSSERTPQDTV